MLKYLITDPEYSLEEIKKAVIKHRPDFVCYRNKLCFNEKEIIEFAEFAKKHCKTFINYDSLKNPGLINFFDGIHLPSSKIDKINVFEKKIVIVSTHTLEEVKKSLKADFITFSPVFDSKGRKGLGIKKLNEICANRKNVIALGGITSDREVEKVKNSKAAGFAGIRYFFT
jgi:thiamine-phosphate pyrophosphorylase